MNITRATIENINQLQTISRHTFYETFSATNSEENMNKYLEEELSHEKLAAELNNPESEFHLAGLDDQIVGYLKVNMGQAQMSHLCLQK